MYRGFSVTEQETHLFDNIGANEKEAYRGKYLVFEHYETIDYSFARHCDDMFSDGKRVYSEKNPYVLIHDFNLYGHGDKSAHYGDPRLPEEERKCVGCDFRWVNLEVEEGLMLCFKWGFKGIFVYPYAMPTPFFHVDWKDWGRPEGIVMYGFRDQAGNMVTCTQHFPEVVRMFFLLSEWNPSWNHSDIRNGVD